MFSEPISYDQDKRTEVAVTSDIRTLVGGLGRAKKINRFLSQGGGEILFF